MRPKSMILIVIALGCGLVASIGISQVMEKKASEGPVVLPTEKVCVAIADVPLGELMEEKMVKMEEWPKDKIPEGAIKKLEDVIGKKPLTRLYPGEPILAAKLVDANKFTGAAEKIPKGFRVASVKVTMDSSASGLINPGDRVDVLVFLKKGRGINMTGTRTILKNVTVFAVNDRFQRDPEDAEGLRAKTVSLLVKPNQVEKVMLASELGKIKLSLRCSDDDAEDAADGATVADLDSGSSKENGNFSIAAATGELAPAQQPAGGITDFLRGMKTLADAPADTSKQAFVMHIHTPNEIQVFNWDDRDSLPRELLNEPPAVEVPAAPPVPATETLPAAPVGGGESFPDFGDDSSAEVDASDDLTGTENTDQPLD